MEEKKCPCDETSENDDEELPPPRIFRRRGRRVYDARDPVRASDSEEELQPPATSTSKKVDFRIRPDITKRLQMGTRPEPELPAPPYVIPRTPRQLREREERRARVERDLNFCKWESLDLPPPYPAETIGTVMQSPSPEVSQTKVRPREPSGYALNAIPIAPEPDELQLRKPKSGIYINRATTPETMDSFDLVYERRPRPRRPGDEPPPMKKPPPPPPEIAELETVSELEPPTPVDDDDFDVGEDETIAEEFLTKLYRRKVSQCSVATSVHTRDLEDFPAYDEGDLGEQPAMSKIVQKFRRDSEAERYKPPPRKIVRGTIESHSFTKLEQPLLKDFYYGVVLGTVNENDGHFDSGVRGAQGICMPVAAYCYAMLLHPNKWTDLVVDDVLEVGSQLYADSVTLQHMHGTRPELQAHQLAAHCVIGTKKLAFQVHEPEVVGQMRSTDRRIYNVTKGLKVFFAQQRAGIVRCRGLNAVVWKDRHYYFFDAKGRTKQLQTDESGVALLAHVYDLAALATILLKHSELGNRDFTISKVSVTKILVGDEEVDRDDVVSESSHFNIVDEHKAVVLASFDLADLCFDFSRNKQAVAMATVGLVYSRISPPSSWHRRTLDKIMVIGNQLYLEILPGDGSLEMGLEHVPAVFTLGPYAVEILIYSNVYADLMAKKGVCVLHRCLEKFFATNTMAIVGIGRATLAVWHQRGIYYCFDPYSRDAQAHKCRNGRACVSMHSTLDSVTSTIAANFPDPDAVFRVHALKVVKIRKAETTFECRGKAVRKPITVDLSERAARELTPWQHLDGSVVEVSSAVGSLAPLPHRVPSKRTLPQITDRGPLVIDLDSPSLSDTQIEPERPEPDKNAGPLDMTSWELTMEELELELVGEDEDYGFEDELEAYLAMNQYAQVHADSLDPCRTSAQINTDITFGFLPIPREILPATDISWKQKMLRDKEVTRRRQMMVMRMCATHEPSITQSQELAKESNFVDLPDGTQIVWGSEEVTAHGGDDAEYMAPFVCMMAAAVAQKYALGTWSKDIVDYTLRSGAKLYALSKVRYDQVPILDVPQVSLGSGKFSILTEYLHDSVLKQRVLEETLMKVLFKKHECGLVATPSYACAVFLKNHLFYLFDCYGCNQVGLGAKDGVACLARFKNAHDLAKRIVYNKTRRDDAEEYEFSRFVISACTSHPLPPTHYEPEAEDEASEAPPRTNRVGYQLNDNYLTLQGSKALEDRERVDYDVLKRDHFVCVCACLLLLNYPILRWDTKRVDYVIDQGNHIYDHADNLSITQKRIIRNILIYQNFFDIIITSIKIPDGDKRNFAKNLEWMTKKKDYILLQFPNCCYVIYKHNDYFHVFDPYPCAPDGSAAGEGNAGWTIFNTLADANARIKKQIAKDGDHFLFYTFEVTSVSKAPKSLIVSQKLLEYEMDKEQKTERLGGPFHERDVWLLKHPPPWSLLKTRPNANRWHCWDVVFTNDLYMLVGTFHQSDRRFDEETRGKQTLANVVVAVAMTQIYPLAEWSAAVVDSVLTYGDAYFHACIHDIDAKDYEFDTDDLQAKCTIVPYTFEVTLIPVVDGTMFVLRPNQFNLYKALRVFFDGNKKRAGLVCCDQGQEEKRFVSFGKTKENEYFMFDCQVNGPPIFLERRAAAYVLRCKTLKRLLYVLTLTLRGGDFFLFEIDIANMAPVE